MEREQGYEVADAVHAWWEFDDEFWAHGPGFPTVDHSLVHVAMMVAEGYGVLGSEPAHMRRARQLRGGSRPEWKDMRLASQTLAAKAMEWVCRLGREAYANDQDALVQWMREEVERNLAYAPGIQAIMLEETYHVRPKVLAFIHDHQHGAVRSEEEWRETLRLYIGVLLRLSIVAARMNLTMRGGHSADEVRRDPQILRGLLCELTMQRQQASLRKRRTGR